VASVKRAIAQVSHNLIEMRLSLGWSAATLAERAGVAPALVEALEAGNEAAFAALNLSAVVAIARVLDCDVGQLLAAVPPPQNQ
jgi:DNA-binding Xre family transcriptional regulator